MKRYAILIALAAVILTTTAAAPAAPRWPSASLAYWQEAEALLDTLDMECRAGLKAIGDPDAIETPLDAVTAAQESAAELDPPPALLPLHTRLAYTAETCRNTLQYASGATNNDDMRIVIPMITQFGIETLRSLNETRVEAARYAATVGGFPER